MMDTVGQPIAGGIEVANVVYKKKIDQFIWTSFFFIRLRYYIRLFLSIVHPNDRYGFRGSVHLPDSSSSGSTQKTLRGRN